MSTSATFTALVLSLAFLLVYRTLQRKRKLYPLPPGPPKLPLIGNLLSIPTAYEWNTYHQWAKDYNSDIIHVSAAGTSLIILDKIEVARELLDKRSSIYSSRPQLTMLTELMGWDYSFVMMNYGEKWRAHRKMAQKSFLSEASVRFRAAESRSTHTLLRRLLVCGRDYRPVDIISELKQMTGSIILSVAYGIQTLPLGDPYIAAADAALETFCIASRPGSFLVDAVPALKYIPEWVPGATFKTKAKEWRKLARRMIEMPFETAKRSFESGNAPPSFVADALAEIDPSQDRSAQEEIVQSVAGALYTGGVDSTLAVISDFVLAMLMFPDVQKKAQMELDAVLDGALPTFEDEERLPYVTAVVKEAFRWKNVAPMGFPHVVDEDDVYNGYYIPNGSIVLPNMWAMFHDKNVFPDPAPFKPERFLTSDGKTNEDLPKPEELVFGFGRRVCPARYMAYNSVWITIASLLSVYDISKERDGSGNIVEPSYEYTSTLAYMPVSFNCSVTLRSNAAESAIKSTED